MPDTSALVRYIRDDVHKDFAKQRSHNLEPGWRLSYDAFRGEYKSENLKRWKALEGSDWRCKVFVKLTKVKVVTGVAHVNDVYLQGGKIPLDISPTPYAETASGLYLPQEIAEQRAANMRSRIEDIHVETGMVRKQECANLEMAIYGLAWLKGPVVRQRPKMKYQMVVPGLNELSLPATPERVAEFGRFVPNQTTVNSIQIDHPNLWDIFWDLEEGPREGRGVIHRVRKPASWFAERIGQRGWNAPAIRRLLDGHNAQGDDQHEDASAGPARQKAGRRGIEALEFHGRVPVKHLRDWNSVDLGGVEEHAEIEIKAIIAGDECIWGPVRSPLPGCARPFYPALWEEVPHETGGVGIPENIRDSQAMVNSAVRCFVDNKALSGNVLMAGNSRNLKPGTSKAVYPGKFFEVAEHIQDVRGAINFFSPPDVGGGLLEMVNLFERFSDQESNLPRMMQGESSDFDPKTAFAFNQLVSYSNKGIGQIVRNIDGGHTEAYNEALYHFLMARDPDENIKGDYTCKATGYTGYNDRLMEGQRLQNFLLFCLSNKATAQYPKVAEMLEKIARKSGIDPAENLYREDEVLERQNREMLGMLAQHDGSGDQEGGAA